MSTSTAVPARWSGLRAAGGTAQPPADRDDPLRADDRDVPCGAGPDDRRDVDPHHRRRPRRAEPAGLGHHRLPDHHDGHHAALRQALRPLRAQAAVPHRHHDLRDRLGGLHVRHVDVRARGVPGGPGSRRGRAVLAGADDHRRHRGAPGAGPVPGLLRGRLRHVERARPGGGRLLRRPGRDPRHRRAGGGSS